MYLSKEFHLQLLNCSSSGCLLETSSRIEVGTIGILRLNLAGDEFSEEVQVVRCQQIAGAGSVYHVGATFLWTASPAGGSLRRAMRRQESPERGRPTGGEGESLACILAADGTCRVRISAPRATNFSEASRRTGATPRKYSPAILAHFRLSTCRRFWCRACSGGVHIHT